MRKITDLSYNALLRYFNTLRQTGYKSYNDVYKLLALLGIEEMLNIFQGVITEDDLKHILKAVNCLSGSTCLIDFPSYQEYLYTVPDLHYLVRITENDNIRIYDDNIKLVE